MEWETKQFTLKQKIGGSFWGRVKIFYRLVLCKSNALVEITFSPPETHVEASIYVDNIKMWAEDWEDTVNACLEALKKEGDYLTKGDYFTERQVSSNGYLVFIPD